jgi:O-antigen ligase
MIKSSPTDLSGRPAVIPILTGQRLRYRVLVLPAAALVMLVMVIMPPVPLPPVAVLFAGAVAGAMMIIHAPFVVLAAVVGWEGMQAMGAIPGVYGLSLGEVALPPLLLVSLWKRFLYEESPPFPSQTKIVLLFMASVLVSSLFMENMAFGIAMLKSLAGGFLLYFTTILVVRTKKDVFRLFLLFSLSVTLSAGLGLVTTMGMQDRFGGLGGVDPNAFGATVITALGFMMVWGFNAVRWSTRLMAIGSIPVLLLAVVSTFSRGTFVSLMAGIALLAWFHRRRIAPPHILFALIIAVALAGSVPSEYVSRITSLAQIGSSASDGSLRRRLRYHLVTPAMLAKRPFFGIGPGNFQHYYTDTSYRYTIRVFSGGRRLHDYYLEVLVECGLVGFVIFMVLLGSFFGTLVSVSRWERREGKHNGFPIATAMLVGAVPFFLASTFLPQMHSKLPWLFFALAACLSRTMHSDVPPQGSSLEVVGS